LNRNGGVWPLARTHWHVKQLHVTSSSVADEQTQGLWPQSGAAHWQVTGWGVHGLCSQRYVKPGPPELRTQISSELQVMPDVPQGVWQGAAVTCHRAVCALQLATETTSLLPLQRS